MRIRIERDGMALDLAIWEALGRPDDMTGIVEMVLDSNRGLADLPLILPLGTEIDIPDVGAVEQQVRPVVRLWD
ncbi:hypothetical protein GCM10019059_35060 [Camelimonas fluminis]|uniref:Tail protein X n=1 Tax=Camelimonas fluminis TaxID=1576911 RepID=A0ABV7UGC8_9HYPH|nr:tail protein X [Camelimonas fluminis]GHE72370.1 hypothetical protein GCM10019059_35060 [Camelimonas fluminis]